MPRGKLTAGQFSERSSSCGEGLHHLPQHEPMRLHTHHSDPFLAKNIPWNHGVPPMYMKLRYNPNLVAPYPIEDMPPGGYGPPPQSGRGARALHKQGPNQLDWRRANSQFYVPPRAGPMWWLYGRFLHYIVNYHHHQHHLETRLYSIQIYNWNNMNLNRAWYSNSDFNVGVDSVFYPGFEPDESLLMLGISSLDFD